MSFNYDNWLTWSPDDEQDEIDRKAFEKADREQRAIDNDDFVRL